MFYKRLPVIFYFLSFVFMVCVIDCKSVGLKSAQTVSSINELNRDTDFDISLIKDFILAVNDKDVERYISLFSSGIQNEMREFIDRSAANYDNFFVEESRELLGVYSIDDSFISENDWLFTDVFDLFDDFLCYYVVENVRFKDGVNQARSGEKSNVYVIVTENRKHCLYRVSAIDYDMVENYLSDSI